MNLPRKPQRGEALDALWGGQVIDALVANRVRAGAGLVSAESSSGTVVSPLQRPLGPGGWFPLDKMTFGLDPAPSGRYMGIPTTFTFKAGPFRNQNLAASWTDDTQLIVEGEGLWYVGVQVTLPSTVEVMALQSDEPQGEDGILRDWWYRIKAVRPQDTLLARIDSINRLGGWYLTEKWSPGS